MVEDSNITTLLETNVETLDSIISDKSPATDLVFDNNTSMLLDKGWTDEQESIVKGWVDIAKCYRYLHDYTEKSYNKKKLAIMIPVVILSAIGGSSGIVLKSTLNNIYIDQNIINVSLGAAGLLSGILTVIGNNLGYAELVQSHATASLNWGSFQHLINIETNLTRSERTKSSQFLRSCRADLNRLIERTPEIPDSAFATIEKQISIDSVLNTANFRKAFDNARIYASSETQMKLAIESAKALLNKPVVNENKN